jgi:four helix bundle protein
MSAARDIFFNHEKLKVYSDTIAFIAWLSELLDEIPRSSDVKDQLNRAAASIALNIAEGNGKYSAKDRCRFFDIAHGSALECAAGLDVLVARTKLQPESIRQGKQQLRQIVEMLIGQIKRNSTREYQRFPDEPVIAID